MAFAVACAAVEKVPAWQAVQLALETKPVPVPYVPAAHPEPQPMAPPKKPALHTHCVMDAADTGELAFAGHALGGFAAPKQ